MNRLRIPGTIIFALILAVVRAQAEAETVNTNAAPPVLEADEEKKWEFSITTYAYLMPDARDYVQPTITADRDWFHFEARYNYENLETGSAWLGYNFSGGKKITWEFTPMVGGVFGETDGVAPGYKGSISWWKFELYSEGEYFFDADVKHDSFFYNWSELTFAPVEWFRFGMVTQRSRTYSGDRDIQRGVLAGFTYKNIDLAGYMINPDESKPTVVISVGLTF